jgi:hypothetical protein
MHANRKKKVSRRWNDAHQRVALNCAFLVTAADNDKGLRCRKIQRLLNLKQRRYSNQISYRTHVWNLMI